jgi:tetratricopeptide (TPR) repeat protein
LYLLLLAGGIVVSAAQAIDPEALYKQRENLPSAQQAADIWAARSAGGKDFESAWKLARACYWLGTHLPEKDRRAALDRGVAAGELAIKLDASKPEGHFWVAANMGTLAESFGLTQGLKYRGRIRDELQKVLAINPAWLQGSADRALGWWYHRVPGLFGGSERLAEEHLRKALGYNPQSTATLFFLAEVVEEAGRKDDARKLLQQVIDAPLDPDWGPEDRDFKRKAEDKLKQLRSSKFEVDQYL